MSASLLALAAAASYAAGYVLTKRFVLTYPPRQLVGPLYLFNSLVLLPAAPFVDWRWSGKIALLLGASVLAMAVSATVILVLLSHASTATVVTGQAISPLPAVVFTAALLPGQVSALQAGLSVLVVGAVVAGLADSFGQLRRRRAGAMVLVGATGTGLVTVLTKLLTEEGVGLVEIYVARTAAAAALLTVLFPPRDLELRTVPAMALRGGLVTVYFVLLILAVQRGSPATVQTLVGTAPLMLLLTSFAFRGERPPLRIALAALAAAGGVLLVLLT